MAVKQPLTAALALVALAGCSDLDLDLRDLGNGLDTSRAAQVTTAPRPDPDSRGLISYPGYQVAIARRGDTVSDVAARVGIPAAEIARFNGIQDGVPLRSGETLVLPRRAPGAAGPAGVDVAAIAGTALDRAGPRTDAPRIEAQPIGPEPTRHRVQPGETAFSIARSYDVTPRALAEWNGLDSEFNVRAGQILLIPVAVRPTASEPESDATVPGQGTLAPEPPSAAQPLPEDVAPAETAAASAAPDSPDLAEERSDDSRLLMPASGAVIRAYEKGRNDGIGISAAAGSPVRAAESGTVAAITRDTDQVPIVVLRHEGNLLTVYAGVDGLEVEKGDSVQRGQTIARVRATDSPYLHFEVRDGFESVDPMPYLN